MSSRGPVVMALWSTAAVLPWALLLALGLAILLPTLPAAPLGRALAWLSALLVVGWLATHLALRLHRNGRLPRDLQHELRFRLLGTRPAPEARAQRRRSMQGWYGGRSRSGERPRFD